MLLLSDRPVSASVWDSLLPVDRNILNFSYQVFATCLPSVCPKSQYSQMCLPICFTYFMYISILLEFWVLFFSFAYALPWIRINFPHSSLDKESACNAGDLGSIPGLGRALEKEMATTPIFLPGESHGQRSLEGYYPWGHKSRTCLATKPPPPELVTSSEKRNSWSR